MNVNWMKVLATGFLLLPRTSHAGETESEVSNRPAILSYDFDGAMLFSDGLRGLSRKSMIARDSTSPTTTPTSSGDASSGFRSLGLRHLHLGFEWLTPRKLRARIKLRPDAVVGNSSSVTEMDTRSGQSLESESPIQLLDAYELDLIRENVEFAVGARDRVLPSWKAYDDILSFGLEARGPAKAFGLFLDTLPGSTSKSRSDFTFSMAVITPQGDIHTNRSKSGYSHDEAPSQKEPYWGGLASTNYRLSDETSFGGTGCLTEETTLGGKVTKTFFEIGITRDLTFSAKRTRTSLDVRQEKYKYKTSVSGIQDLQVAGASLTSLVGATSDLAVLLGVRTGTGTRHSDLNTGKALSSRGAQGEIGIRAWLGDGLEATTLVTREWRKDENDTEGEVGAFGLPSEGRAVISRFALQISYRTGATL